MSKIVSLLLFAFGTISVIQLTIGKFKMIGFSSYELFYQVSKGEAKIVKKNIIIVKKCQQEI